MADHVSGITAANDAINKDGGILDRLDAIDGEDGALSGIGVAISDLNNNKADKSAVYTKDEIDETVENLSTSINGVGEIATDAQRKIDTFMGTVESSTEVVDTLEEIIALINSEDAELSEALLNEINGLKAKFNADGKALEAVNADTLDNKHATDFATAAQGAKADTTAQTISGYGDIVTRNASEFATATQGAKADAAATAIAGHGDIVTHNVAEFATAAQGALADSAIQQSDIDALALGTMSKENTDDYYTSTQTDTVISTELAKHAGIDKVGTITEVECAEATGLKATTNTDGKVTIDFIENVIFVFDGGDAFGNPLNA